jgi:hypothetical protein
MESKTFGATLNKRLIDATFEDLSQFLDDYIANSQAVKQSTPENKTVKGLKGIAQALKISTRQVSRLKKSGILDGVIRQCGNLIYAKENELINCFKTLQK